MRESDGIYSFINIYLMSTRFSCIANTNVNKTEFQASSCSQSSIAIVIQAVISPGM